MIPCKIKTKTHSFVFENGIVNLKANNIIKTLEVFVKVEVIKIWRLADSEFNHQMEVYHFTFKQEDIVEVYVNNKKLEIKRLFEEIKL